MTNEEALKHIKPRLKLYIQCTDDNIALHTAVKALEKQIPQKVERNKCPICGKDVVGSGFYCWNCGQRLDWNYE